MWKVELILYWLSYEGGVDVKYFINIYIVLYLFFIFINKEMFVL